METVGTIVQTVGLLVMAIAFGWATISLVRDFADDIGCLATLLAVLLFGGTSIACGFGFVYQVARFANVWVDNVQWISTIQVFTSLWVERVRWGFEQYVLWALLILVGTLVAACFGTVSVYLWRQGVQFRALLVASIPAFYIFFFVGPGIALFLDRIIGVNAGAFADTYLGVAKQANEVGLKVRDYVEYLQAFTLLATAIGVALAGGTRLVEKKPGYRRYVGIGPISFLFVLLAAIIAGSAVYEDVKSVVGYLF